MSEDDAKISAPHQTKKISAQFVPPKDRQNPARWAYTRLVQTIIDFEKKLDDDQEVGGRLVSFSEGDAFHIEDIGYWGPDFIIFYGSMGENRPVELIQHLSQISVMLIAMPKQVETKEARRIGFTLAERLGHDQIVEE